MSTDPKFHMIIDDVFSIRNRGTVVTGKIDDGELKVGDEIKIIGINGEKTTTVTGIEAFRKVINLAKPGDRVGIILKDLSKDDVRRRDEIICPDSDSTGKP